MFVTPFMSAEAVIKTVCERLGLRDTRGFGIFYQIPRRLYGHNNKKNNKKNNNKSKSNNTNSNTNNDNNNNNNTNNTNSRRINENALNEIYIYPTECLLDFQQQTAERFGAWNNKSAAVFVFKRKVYATMPVGLSPGICTTIHMLIHAHTHTHTHTHRTHIFFSCYAHTHSFS